MCEREVRVCVMVSLHSLPGVLLLVLSHIFHVYSYEIYICVRENATSQSCPQGGKSWKALHA